MGRWWKFWSCTYKQRFENDEDTDEFLFAFSLVPLRLNDGHKIIWQNPRRSSIIYCRPIQFVFAKETTELIVRETNQLLEDINHLLPTVINFADSQISVKHELLLTVTDGKYVMPWLKLIHHTNVTYVVPSPKWWMTITGILTATENILVLVCLHFMLGFVVSNACCT